MPKLSAEESLLSTNRATAGSALTKPEARKALIRTWERAAERTRTQPRKAPPLSPRMASSMGIRVIREPQR